MFACLHLHRHSSCRSGKARRMLPSNKSSKCPMHQTMAQQFDAVNNSRDVYRVIRRGNANLSTSLMPFFLLFTSSNYCRLPVNCGVGHFELMLEGRQLRQEIRFVCRLCERVYLRSIFKLYLFDVYLFPQRRLPDCIAATSFSHYLNEFSTFWLVQNGWGSRAEHQFM